MIYKTKIYTLLLVFVLLVCVGCIETSDETKNVYEVTPVECVDSTPIKNESVVMIVNDDVWDFEIDMINNINSIDVSYNELVRFIKEDQIDKIIITNNFTEADSAITLHNNAEKAGIKTAIVYYEDTYYYDYFNAFNTTDRGLVYICCVGDADPEFPCNNDWEYKNMVVGKVHTMQHLYKDSCWDKWNVSMKTGILEMLEIVW